MKGVPTLKAALSKAIHDDLDRLVKVTRTKDGANTTPEWELDYEYDANGNLLRVSDTGGELWSLAAPSALYGTAKYGEGRYNGALDAMDRPRGIAKGATVHATFRYDIEGRRTGVDFDNGARTDVAFDIVGRPLSLATSNENGSLPMPSLPRKLLKCSGWRLARTKGFA